MQNTQQPQIDLTTTTAVEGFDGGQLFGQAFVLRKVSKFIVGGDEDGIIPIGVFYDLDSKKIILDSLPPELRSEYKEISL